MVDDFARSYLYPGATLVAVVRRVADCRFHRWVWQKTLARPKVTVACVQMIAKMDATELRIPQNPPFCECEPFQRAPHAQQYEYRSIPSAHI